MNIATLIFNSIILIGIITDYLYIRKLEHDIDALKSWIKVFYHMDLDKVGQAIREQKGQTDD